MSSTTLNLVLLLTLGLNLEPVSSAGNCRIVLNFACNATKLNSLTEANYFPNTIRSDMRTCVLRNCGLVSVRREIFHGYTKVHTIDLSYNYLSSIGEGTFKDCGSLHTLALNDNMLMYLYQDIFKPMTKLVRLYLHNNFLLVTDSNLPFPYGKVNVHEIRADNNYADIRELFESGTFHKSDKHLDHLVMARYNQMKSTIVTQKPDEKLKSLLTVDVTFFNLSRNSLHSVQGISLNTYFSVITLDLSHNSFTNIPTGAFKRNTHLLHLHVDNNRIEDIGDDLFGPRSSINTLTLHGNRIKSLPLGVFSVLIHLETLTLNDNGLASLPEDLFKTNIRLKHLDVSENHLTTLAQNQFLFNPGLVHLDFSHNQLTDFPFDYINHMIDLKTLRLDNNELEYLAPTTMALYSLKLLTLACNRFVFMPEHFLKVVVKTPRNVTLHGNPWKCSCLNMALTIITNTSMIRYEKKMFTDGTAPTCVLGENSMVCDRYPLYANDYLDWDHGLSQRPGMCATRYSVRSGIKK